MMEKTFIMKITYFTTFKNNLASYFSKRGFAFTFPNLKLQYNTTLTTKKTILQLVEI